MLVFLDDPRAAIVSGHVGYVSNRVNMSLAKTQPHQQRQVQNVRIRSRVASKENRKEKKGNTYVREILYKLPFLFRHFSMLLL